MPAPVQHAIAPCCAKPNSLFRIPDFRRLGILTSPQQPIDRLWVYTRLNWLPRADPVELRLRIDLPAQAPCMMMVQPCIGPQNGLAKTSSCVWQLRFHPLRAGDTLRVWAEFEGGQLSCGDLLAITPEAATRH